MSKYKRHTDFLIEVLIDWKRGQWETADQIAKRLNVHKSEILRHLQYYLEIGILVDKLVYPTQKSTKLEAVFAFLV